MENQPKNTAKWKWALFTLEDHRVDLVERSNRSWDEKKTDPSTSQLLPSALYFDL